MANDEIVEEIHRFRREWAAKFGYDVKAMAQDLRERFERGEFGTFRVVDRSQAPPNRMRRTGT